MTELPKSRIAFLGLGNMGNPMSAHLAAAGHVVRGFDPSSAASAAAARNGVSIVDNASAAVAESNVVITMLPNGDAVKGCYTEILDKLAPGALLIDSSTISVEDARHVNDLARGCGVDQLDAPVSGGVAGAAAATLAFMVGGSAEALKSALPVLECMAANIIHCGSRVPGRPPRSATTWCLRCTRSWSPRRFCSPENSA